MADDGKSSNELLRIIKVLLMCLIYIILSGGLIYFNKYLVNKHRFPHPMQLTCCHMIGSTVLSLLCYAFFPSMFPGVERTKGKKLQVYKQLIPIGVFFAINLYGSNKAYLYCSISFLQFMKEVNISLVFLVSCLFGLQTMHRKQCLVILWIVAGGCYCVSGEMDFAIIGFMFQAVSQICECLRVVLVEIALNGDLKLDPLSYTMYIAPICVVVLGISSAVTWHASVWTDLMIWWPLIIPNACLAFALNVWIALVIREVTSVGFLLSGITKDIVLVLFAAIFLHDTVTGRQWICFSVMMSGVFFWSFMKMKPDHIIIRKYERLLGMPDRKVDETTPLAPEAEKKV